MQLLFSQMQYVSKYHACGGQNDELIGILGQVWYLIVSIPDLCILTYYTYSKRVKLYVQN